MARTRKTATKKPAKKTAKKAPAKKAPAKKAPAKKTAQKTPAKQLAGRAKPAAPVVVNGIIQATDKTFRKIVSDAHQRGPLLIDFWADWCQPCTQLGPKVEEAAAALAGEVTVIKANVDDCPHAAADFNVESIPLLVLIRGEDLWGAVGYDDDVDVTKWVRACLAGEHDDDECGCCGGEHEHAHDDEKGCGCADHEAGAAKPDADEPDEQQGRSN